MRSQVIRVDVGAAAGHAGAPQCAATVHFPECLDGPRTVIFGYPGGGYNRGYYDIRLLPGYSQALHHTSNGCIFVACDHLGIGDSTPVDPFELNIERMAAANHAAMQAAVQGLRSGTLAQDIPSIDISRVTGIGQSMGGCLLVAQQGLHRSFNAIAVLGYGVTGSSFARPEGGRITFPAPPRSANLGSGIDAILGEVATHAEMLRHSFHAADEEPELIEADMGPSGASAPWRATVMPPSAAMMMGAGAVAAEAARIDVPVLVAAGEIDLVSNPWNEPSAYRSSRDVSVYVVKSMAHMHNFARTRLLLWRRIDRFAETIGGD